MRCPTELVAAAKALDRDKSRGCIRMMDIANDAMTALGEAGWLQVQLYAHENKCTEGEALGQLASAAMKKRRRP